MTREYDFVGEQRMLVDICGVSPWARCVIPKDANAHEVLAKIVADIRAAFERHCLYVYLTEDHDGGELASFTSTPEIINTREEENAAWEKNSEELGAIFRQRSEERITAFANNPDNGKHGYWAVDGVRHDGFVLASSEAEAVEKAITSGVVGDWESPTARYVGERPEAMS